MSIRGMPTQPSMGMPGLQMAPGAAQRPGLTQVSPGTSAKWNSGQYDPSFPKPVGHRVDRGYISDDPSEDESECCNNYTCKWAGDHLARLFLLLLASLVFALTLVALISGLNTLSSNAFFYFSKFAWEQWFPSFFVIMVMLMLLSLVAMAVVFFAVFISCFERRALVRAFYISAVSLGVIMLSLALFCWLYGNRAKPYVLRAGNLLCQDPKIWHCTGASAPPDVDRRLSNESAFGILQDLEGDAEAVLADLPAEADRTELRRPGSRGRRLNPAAASLAFVKSLNGAVNPQTNEPEACTTIMDICTPPTGFNLQTACVCSGNWDYAPVGTNAPSTTANAVLPNELGTTVEPVNPYEASAQVVTVEPIEAVTASTSPATTQLETTQAPATTAAATAAPATGRLLREDVGPWLGSLGAFCGKWGNDDFVEGEWCFVLPNQLCEPNARSQYVSTRGYPMIRSTAPCGDSVDSRSELLLKGHVEMTGPLTYTALLGGALIAMAGAGYLLYLYPSRETTYQALRRESAPPRAQFTPYAPQSVQREAPSVPAATEPPKSSYNFQRFQEAQAKAVNKLSVSTPEELRLQIYAYYKQATEGDVQGDRPTYFNQKERAKFDAWVKCRGMSFDDAVNKYCDVVDRL